MKTTIYKVLFLVCCVAALVSCKDKNAFVLSGEVKNPQAVKKIYLLSADASALNVIDSAALSDQNKFSFKHASPMPLLYKLRVGSLIFDLIAQNGDDINFTTDLKDTTESYDITGSAESQKIKEYNKINNFYSNKNIALNDEYQAEVQKTGQKPEAVLPKYVPQFQHNIDAYAQDVLKFMNDNKTSLASFYAANSVDPMRYEPQLVAYADAIRNNFPKNAAVQAFLKHMDEIKPISVGHKAPDFALMDADNKPVKLSDYAGKYLMVDFWASWCAPCRQENPNVVKNYALYKDKGLNILGVSLDDDRTPWLKAIADDKLIWRQASEFKKFDGPVEKLYHIEAIPSNFIIDPKGNIIAKNISGNELEEFLNKTFNKPQ